MAHGPRFMHRRLASLDAEQADSLFDQLTSVVAASLTPAESGPASWAAQDWRRRQDTIVRDCSLYEARCGDELVGFVAYRTERLLGRPTVDLVAACVRPEFQTSGLAYAMNARIIMRALAARPAAGCFIGAHVLNPVALNGWRVRVRDSANFYPHIGDVDPPNERLLRAAEEFAERHDRGLAFDSSTGVVTGKHLPGYRNIGPSGSTDVDHHFRRHVDSTRGDTVLMLMDGTVSTLISQAGTFATAIRRSVLPNRSKRQP